MRSIPNADGKPSRAEMPSSSLKDYSIAGARPAVSPSIGSRSNRPFYPSLASRSHAASTADNTGVFKPSSFQSTLNPKTRNEGNVLPVYATKQGGSNAIDSHRSLRPIGTSRNKQVSKPNANQSALTPKENMEGHVPAGRANFPLHSKGTTSHKHVSKPAANHTTLKPKIMNTGHVCAARVAKQGGPSAVGKDVHLDSQNTARNKVFGVYKIFQHKPKEGQLKHTCAGFVAKQNGQCERGSISALHSQPIVCSKQSNKSRDMKSKPQAIQEEGVTRKIPGKSPSIRSSSNALSSNNSHASFARGGSKTIVSTASLLSKDTERSKHRYKSRGIQSKLQAIRREGVTRKGPEKYTSVSELNKAFSNQSIASLAPTNKGSKGRDASRSVVSGNGAEAAKTSLPHDLAVSLHENGTTSRLFETTAADSLSTLSLPSTSTARTRYSILASDGLNPVYPGDRYGSQDRDGDYSSGYDSSGYDLSGDESSGGVSSEGSRPKSSEVGKVVDSIRSRARDILSSDVDDNVWLGKDVLKGISEWKKASVDAFIESACDKLDELDNSLPACDGSKK